MAAACKEFPALRKLDKARQEEVCAQMREDGAFIEAGENDNLIVQRLQQEQEAL